MSVKDLILLPVEMKKSPYGEGIKGYDLQMIHSTKALQSVARLACALIERWGLVAGEIDGEDSAGRSKLRRLTPEELVKDACATADAAWSEFEARGWLLEVPIPVKSEKKIEEDA